MIINKGNPNSQKGVYKKFRNTEKGIGVKISCPDCGEFVKLMGLVNKNTGKVEGGVFCVGCNEMHEITLNGIHE
jgi:hypothetical protein